MTARLLHIALLTVGMFVCLAPARADLLCGLVDGVKEFGRSVVRDTKRRNCWPEPFVAPDRYAVRAPLALMVSNGWRRQNLLGEHHFVDQGGELTEAGEMKVRWILTEAPPQHRTIYVHSSGKPEVTATRINNVQQLAARLVPQGELPLVLETGIPVQGWPAARADTIGREFEKSLPKPELPKASSGGTESK